MDRYARLTKAWLDNRYRCAFDPATPNLHYGHQPIYGIGAGHCEPNHARRIVRLFQLLLRVRAAGGRSLLDVGGSEGYFAQLCRELFGMTTVSVDLSEEACRRAAEIFAMPGAAVDAAALPFATGSFDVVTCAEVIEHVADPVPTILELQRVARCTLVLGTEEWLADSAARDRVLAERHTSPHGERNVFADADLTTLFAPFPVTFERQVLPDLADLGDDRNIDRSALRQLLLDLGAGRIDDAERMGIVLTARKPAPCVPLPRTPSRAEIADHLLSRRQGLHLLGAPTPALPWPDGIAARCVACGDALLACADALTCRCGERFPRRRGVWSFLRDLPPFPQRLDAMLRERGGPATAQQRDDLLALAQKLDLPFVARASWDFGDPDQARVWHHADSCRVLGPGHFQVDGDDPWLQIDALGCDPDEARIVTVVMAVHLDDRTAPFDVAEVSRLVDGQLTFSSNCSAGVLVVTDGTLRTYHFEAPPSLRGDAVLQLRFDPLSCHRGRIEIRSIGIARSLDDG